MLSAKHTIAPCSEYVFSFFSFLMSRMFSCVLQIFLSRFNPDCSTCFHLTICLELVFRQLVGEEFCLPDGFFKAARGSQLK